MVKLYVWLALAAICVSAASASAQTNDNANRPGLTVAEGVPRTTATCETIATTLDGFATPDTRVDLWITGRLTLVSTDDAVWFLAVCSSPGIRVMCVTYESNGMHPGDVVTLRGGYNRQAPLHVVLDPCLASTSFSGLPPASADE